MTRPVVDEYISHWVCWADVIVQSIRKQAPEKKQFLIDEYCRKCKNHANINEAYEACKGCQVSKLLNLLVEVMG